MTRKIMIAFITLTMTTGAMVYGFSSQRSASCPLEGRPDCPKIGCPLKGTPWCPYEDAKVAACCLKK